MTRINCKRPLGPTAKARRAKAAKRQRVYRRVCAGIDREHGENGYVECVKCGRWVRGIHHDHIRPRSVAPELRTVRENIQPVCADCHLAEHAAGQ